MAAFGYSEDLKPAMHYNMYKYLFYFICLGVIACKSSSENSPSDSATEGIIYITVDESFRPIMEEQIRVYEALHPQTKIVADYKSEAACWEDLYNDSTRMVIVTKKLTPGETKYYYDSLGVYPESGQLAYDAVALVVNKSAKDSVFTQEAVKKMLQGRSDFSYRLVFDGNKATSTVRYALDSILKGVPADFTRISAAKTGKEVVEFVSSNVNYIGFVGVSCIGNPEDTMQQSLREKVRIAWIGCRNCAAGQIYSHPAQEEILYNRYPYTRGVYYVLKETHAGLGRAFVNFMKKDQGQLIFRRGYLVPAWRPHLVRETVIR
jgi:phosphate transport system substrate-binding protein